MEFVELESKGFGHLEVPVILGLRDEVGGGLVGGGGGLVFRDRRIGGGAGGLVDAHFALVVQAEEVDSLVLRFDLFVVVVLDATELVSERRLSVRRERFAAAWFAAVVGRHSFQKEERYVSGNKGWQIRAYEEDSDCLSQFTCP